MFRSVGRRGHESGEYRAFRARCFSKDFSSKAAFGSTHSLFFRHCGSRRGVRLGTRFRSLIMAVCLFVCLSAECDKLRLGFTLSGCSLSKSALRSLCCLTVFVSRPRGFRLSSDLPREFAMGSACPSFFAYVFSSRPRLGSGIRTVQGRRVSYPEGVDSRLLVPWACVGLGQRASVSLVVFCLLYLL